MAPAAVFRLAVPVFPSWPDTRRATRVEGAHRQQSCGEDAPELLRELHRGGLAKNHNDGFSRVLVPWRKLDRAYA